MSGSGPSLARRRGGFTLIETLVVITIVTFICGTIVTVLGALGVADRTARRERTDAAAMEDAGEQFRRSAHDALGAEPAADFAADGSLDHIRFDFGGGAWMEFRLAGQALEVRGSRPTADGEPASRAQRFELPGRGSPRLGLERRDGRLVAVLAWPWPEVSRARGPDAAIRPPWRVEAIVGRDRAAADVAAGGGS